MSSKLHRRCIKSDSSYLPIWNPSQNDLRCIRAFFSESWHFGYFDRKLTGAQSDRRADNDILRGLGMETFRARNLVN